MINKKLSRSGSECILAWRSWRIHASISSARGCMAPPMNAESDIMREEMHGKQTGTRLGTRPPAYYEVTGIYRHIPPGHANKCSQSFPTSRKSQYTVRLLATKANTVCLLDARANTIYLLAARGNTQCTYSSPKQMIIHTVHLVAAKANSHTVHLLAAIANCLFALP